MPLVNVSNRIVGATLDSGGGPVDVFPFMEVGGVSYSSAIWKKAVVGQASLRFVDYADGQFLDLDRRTNNIWCRGSVFTLTAVDEFGSQYQVCELVVLKTKTLRVQQVGQEVKPVEIAVQLGDYLTELNGVGKAILLNQGALDGQPGVFVGLLSNRTLAEQAILRSTERSLDVDLDGIDETLIPGRQALRDNQSPADLAAEAAAPSLHWIWQNSQGQIRASERIPGEQQGSPLLRYSLEELAEAPRLLDSSEDLATEVYVTGNKRIAVPDALPFNNTVESYAPANNLFPGLGSQVVLASQVVTNVDQNGLRTIEETRPLAAWMRFGDTGVALTSAERAQLLTYYKKTTIDSRKQYNAQDFVVEKETEQSGIIGIFRENFQGTIADVLSDVGSVLTPVTLSSVTSFEYTNDLPLNQSGYEEYLADNDKNAPIDTSNNSNEIARNDWTDDYTPWPARTQFYNREFTNSKRRETGYEERVGPPLPERREPTSQVGNVLLEGSYAPEDVSVFSCGTGKPIQLDFDYAQTAAQMDAIARIEVERRIERDRAIEIEIPLSRALVERGTLFPRIDVGARAYRLARWAFDWDSQGGLTATLELDEIGTLGTPVQPPPEPSYVFPPSAPRIFEPITPPANCGAGPTIPDPPTALTINKVGSLSLTADVAMSPLLLSATGGAPPYTFDAPGGLPAGLSIGGNFVTGTPTTESVSTGYTIRVTDGLFNTDTTTLTIEVLTADAPTPVLPYVRQIVSSAGYASNHGPIAYDLNPPPVSLTSSVGYSSEVNEGVAPPLNVISPVGYASQVVTVTSITSSVGYASEVELGPVQFTSSTGYASRVVEPDGFNPFEVEYHLNLNLQEFDS